jgi:hypothetical protein
VITTEGLLDLGLKNYCLDYLRVKRFVIGDLVADLIGVLSCSGM